MAAAELNLVIDKSALQALSHDECFWLHHFTRSVITPVLYMEILGNLRKDWKGSRSPEGFLSGMAKKAKGHFSSVSISSDILMRKELRGMEIEMQGRPFVGNARMVTDSYGKMGILVREAEEQKDLLRWTEKDFSEAERELALGWRKTLEQLEQTKGKAPRRPDGLRSLNDVINAVDGFLSPDSNQWQILSLALRLAGVRGAERNAAKGRWLKKGRPPATRLLPYCCFVTRCTLIQQLGEAAQFLPQRPTNAVDLLYLHYLPFCQLFISGDKVHSRIAPYLLRPNQAFICSNELKESLQAIKAHYDALDDEQKSKGAAKYARYLPIELNTPLHAAFDKTYPEWRKKALEPPPPPLSKEKEKELLEEFRAIKEAIERSEEDSI